MSTTDVIRDEKPKSPLEAVVALSTSNPAMDDIPELRTMTAVCTHLEQTSQPGGPSDAYDYTAPEIVGYAVKRLLRAMRDSAIVRDVTCHDYQRRLYGAFNFLSYHRNAHGNVVQAATVSLPGAIPRTMILCGQEGMQLGGLRNAILKLFDQEGRVTVVRSATGGFLRVPRKLVLHLECPPDCDPTTLLLDALQAFNAAFNIVMTQRSLGLVSGNQFPDARLLVALVIGGNIGVVIISGVRAADAGSKRARIFFSMLAIVSQSTGVPILFLCTSGAVPAIMKQGAVYNALRTLGAYEILPAEADSSSWKAACAQAWTRYLAPIYSTRMPTWFPAAIWEKTQGLDDLRTLVCDSIANKAPAKSDGTPTLTLEQFNALADAALFLDVEYLDIIRRAASGKPGSRKLSRSNVRRFPDYLRSAWSRALLPSNDKNDTDFIYLKVPPEEDKDNKEASK